MKFTLPILKKFSILDSLFRVGIYFFQNVALHSTSSFSIGRILFNLNHIFLLPKATYVHHRQFKNTDKYKEGKFISVIPPPRDSYCISFQIFFIQIHIFLNNDEIMLYITLFGVAFSLNYHDHNSIPIK